MPAWCSRRPALSPVVEAALLMVVGAVCVAVQNGLIRVASAEIHTFEVVFFRNLFGLLAMLPLLGGVGLGMFRAHSPGRLLLMSAWHVLGMVCYFLAIVYLPLAEVTALAFSKPLFVTVGAWFAEVPSVWTWLGGALIFGATAYIAERETRLSRMRGSAPKGDAGAITTPSAAQRRGGSIR
jgi:drug/metabolite transporter (DMT)-like permease